MAPKRKVDDTDFEANSAAPPSLPPSVEEAYRRKCVQLKHRTVEVEESNDAARLRLSRIKRQVEKLRIERAFLLEQLAKRTSANVEDSEGSPSPPPTPQPQERPLRTKRGYRKISGGGDGDTKVGDSFQHPASPTQEASSRRAKGATTNGVSKSQPPAKSAFELYSEEQRPILEAKNKEDSTIDIEDELSKGWEELPEADKEGFQIKADESLAEKKDADDAADNEADAASPEKSDEAKEDKAEEGDNEKPEAQDEDVEMANYDTDEQETQMDKDGDVDVDGDGDGDGDD